MSEQKAVIRVGKCLKKGYGRGAAGYSTPVFEDYIPIRVHSMERDYGELSPYRLSDARGRTIENLWQFSKVYASVRKSIQYKGFTRNVIWNWPAEVHYADEIKPTISNIDINKLNSRYWEWRRVGFNNDYAVRYPNTYAGRHEPICAIWPTQGLWVEDKYFSLTKAKARLSERPDIQLTEPDMNGLFTYDVLDYVNARKRIYCGLYAELAKAHPKFLNLKRELARGNKLIISEVDGPSYDDHWPYNQVVDNSIPFTYDICKHLINDTSHPFGHGYTIAALLMGWDDIITDDKLVLGGNLNNYTLKS